VKVPRNGIEPLTRGFSVIVSTLNLLFLNVLFSSFFH
jgi:hypothetical protein